jgi:osmoprotectant transport system ATP-binding protein
MAPIEFRDVWYEVGGKQILRGINLTLEAGETLVLLGRSGSGKTTALRLMNGMLFPSRGQVLVDGKPTTAWDPIQLKRGIGYVIQEIGLFPHFTASENVGLVPKLEGWQEADIRQRVARLLETVGLPERECAERYPRELSGGQRQRVGVARALAADPPILLLDEPFGALDPVTRANLQRQFLDLQRNFRKTAAFVTHDVREALRLGDRIVLLADGKIDVQATRAAFRQSDTDEARMFLACLED